MFYVFFLLFMLKKEKDFSIENLKYLCTPENLNKH